MAGSHLRDPIILVHGILGFTELRVGGLKLGDYFRNIREALQADGNTVPEPPQLNPAGEVEARAEDLQDYLKHTLPGRQVHLIAHSMGGLDSRYLISCLGMADRVLSLTTIGTPHHGTPVADQGVQAVGNLLKAVSPFGVDLNGFFDLTTAACAHLNKKAGDAPNVKYYSIAGQFDPALLDLLKVPHDIICNAGEGPNDGLVPVKSAKYRTFLGIWPCDHFRLINWATNVLTPIAELDDTTVVELYRALVRRLAEDGF